MKKTENLFWGIWGIIFFLFSVVYLVMGIIEKNLLWSVASFLVMIMAIWVSIISFSDYYKEKGKEEK